MIKFGKPGLLWRKNSPSNQASVTSAKMRSVSRLLVHDIEKGYKSQVGCVKWQESRGWSHASRRLSPATAVTGCCRSSQPPSEIVILQPNGTPLLEIRKKSFFLKKRPLLPFPTLPCSEMSTQDPQQHDLGSWEKWKRISSPSDLAMRKIKANRYIVLLSDDEIEDTKAQV